MSRSGNNLTRHHILCSSRRPDLKEIESNIALVSEKEHQRLHALFSDKLPTEQIDYLVETFWGGNKQFVRDYLDE